MFETKKKTLGGKFSQLDDDELMDYGLVNLQDYEQNTRQLMFKSKIESYPMISNLM